MTRPKNLNETNNYRPNQIFLRLFTNQHQNFDKMSFRRFNSNEMQVARAVFLKVVCFQIFLISLSGAIQQFKLLNYLQM